MLNTRNDENGLLFANYQQSKGYNLRSTNRKSPYLEDDDDDDDDDDNDDEYLGDEDSCEDDMGST